jgi:GTP-binding protein EngB required for normal cell division
MMMKKRPLLIIIGNSNVGKSSITRLLVPNPKLLKGQSGKQPGSTLLIKPIYQQNMAYEIIDLPGFGYIKHVSKRREEHIKRRIVEYIEKHHHSCFLVLIVINILRIEDEIQKYYINNQATIPLSFELLNFFRDFNVPILIIINKIDKLSHFDKESKLAFFTNTAREYNIPLSKFEDIKNLSKDAITYLEFSALKKTNLYDLKKIVKYFLIKDEISS